MFQVVNHLAEERTRWRRAVGAVLAILAVANVVSNRLLPAALYVPWNLIVAVGVVLIARRFISTEAMGFTQYRRGLTWGMAILAATIVVLLAAQAIPTFHDLFRDKRVSASLPTMLYQSLIRIPFGTSLLEETAFRAALPALFAARWGVVRGCLAASACFGLWHILPALGLNAVNPTANSVFGNGNGAVTVAVVFAVAATMAGGLFWCALRYRSGSVLTTMIAHVATNSVAYIIAWFVGR